eukprot:CAMPEP_0206518616 /NCGR_PEP_ID=MMETSP0324_2-20121206/64682_1 /ASSEMBLY_ACC=CAM_ASM_000836 /TAXON_ID=2866 /ORGANISM="Crypthecodinium cohnii, Strain Seligo" /LENGTH=1240 /DNA_ID=CAMNT_0054012001 /DNA_START=164 /DNA_END=3886 /DNA_ORIENTATION=-
MSSIGIPGPNLLAQYPLRVSIPRSTLASGALHITRHTEYVVVIDDCGREYPPRLRRFRDFKWLHDGLRRQQLAGALPELPPTKTWGRFDVEFVEQRRNRLEEYLQALLIIPSVVQDNLVWSFLDTDAATVAVPRFICRSADPLQLQDRLKQLKLCVQGEEIFRLCNPAVTTDLAALVREEGAEAIQLPNVRVLEDARMRLKNRSLLCSVVQLLLGHERAELARQLLIEAGLFGALLQLLRRAAGDREQAAAAAAAATAAAAAATAAVSAAVGTGTAATATTTTATGSAQHAAAELKDLYDKVVACCQDCLQSMIERSKGAALLHFCQQDGGLSGLRDLVDAESLHSVLARLLWYGLQHDGVVVALSSNAAGGLPLLAQLMSSADLKARLLATLSLGCVAAHPGALTDAQKQECYDRIADVRIPTALDMEETAAMERGVKEAADRAATLAITMPRGGSHRPAHVHGASSEMVSKKSKSSSVPPGGAGHHAHMPRGSSEGARPRTISPRFPSASFTTLSEQQHSMQQDEIAQVMPKRRPDLVELLARLCSAAGLPRLAPLLQGPVTHLSLLVVGVLDNFTRQVEDRQRLLALRGLLPQLQRVLEQSVAYGSEEMTGSAVLALDDSSLHELKVRTARVLVRVSTISSPSPSSSYGRNSAGDDPYQDTPTLEACRLALQTLDVLTMHSEGTQLSAKARLDHTLEHSRDQEDLIHSSGLADPPCLPTDRLLDFAQMVNELAEKRQALGQDVHHTQQTSEAVLTVLDQYGVKHGIFKSEILTLQAEVESQQEVEQAYLKANARVGDLEEAHRVALETMRRTEEEYQTCKKEHWELQRKAHNLECQALNLKQRENQLVETCSMLPKTAMELEERRQEIVRRKSSLDIELLELSARIDGVKARLAEMSHDQEEAQDAFKTVTLVRNELSKMKEWLANEVVHTAQEIDNLKALEAKLQPSRPSRLRRAAEEPPEDTTAIAGSEGDGRAPVWERNCKAESGFQASPNFRALLDLCDVRGQLWDEEIQYLRELIDACKTEQQRYQAAQVGKKREEERSVLDEEQVRREIVEVNDREGHEERLAHATQEALAAQHDFQEASRLVADRLGKLSVVEAERKNTEEVASALAQELRQAQEAAHVAMEKSTRSCSALEMKSHVLQDKAQQQIRAWQEFRQKECWLNLLQERVAECIQTESLGRSALRAETCRLMEELKRFDQQLAVEPLAGIVESPPEALHEEGLQEAPEGEGVAE